MAAAGKHAVLLVSNHADIIGGGEISLLTLVQGLRATRWRPHLAVPGPGEVARRCRALDVPVHETPLPPIRRPGPGMLAAARSMRRLIARTGARVVHANGSRAMFYAGLARRSQHCLAIWHLRILEPDPPLDPLLVRLADGVIAISEAVRERLRRWPRVHQACRVIPNGLDLHAFADPGGRSKTRTALGLNDDQLVVMCVSRLIDFKRHDLLLEAIAALRPAHPTLRCVLVGDGPAAATLQDRAARPDLRDAVIFTGHRDDVVGLLHAADVFVLPSPAEGFGRVVIEAMAAGLPVVASRSGGPAEIIADGDTGMLVEPHSAAALQHAIAGLAGDAAARARIGGAARQAVADTYTIAAHTRRVVAFYEELLARADRRPARAR
jgi:glycosyltransferase involved in cell wall biosynthesis